MQRNFFDMNQARGDISRFDDFPHVAPFLADKNFTAFPVHSPTFQFSPRATNNILLIQEIKSVLIRIDDLVWRNRLDKHPCLIAQAGAQSTMRLGSKTVLRGDWNTTVEMPFCFYLTTNGYCPRTFDFEDLNKQAQWLVLFEEVIIPLDQMEDSKLSFIAPHQHSDIVKKALMKSKKDKLKKHSKTNAETDYSSSGDKFP